MSEEKSASGYGLAGAGDGRHVAAPDLPYLPPRPRTFRPRIGLIGCGGISEYHLRAYRALGLEVAALCDVDPARAERRRAEFFPDAAVFTDHRELLRRSDVEVVDLALHPAERIRVIEDVLRAHRHVLSQKPFVLDLDAGARLADLADTMGVRLAVNQNGRWAPHFAWMTSAVRAGWVGRVASVDFTLQWDHTWTAGTPFEEIRHLVLFDFGIHWFDLTARLMAGRAARRVTASITRTAFQKMRPPMLAAVLVEYDDAQVRMAFNGHVIHGQEDRTVICGETGTLRSAGPSLSDQHVTLHTAAGAAKPRLEGTWFTSGFQGAMGELLSSIEEKRAPDHDARGNLDGLALCFAALASADTGRPVTPGKARRAPGH
ncbi:MAG: Gfo/Idh/MocA family protein [Opitutaceae bacterium]